MTVVGITGHRALADPVAVRAALDELLVSLTRPPAASYADAPQPAPLGLIPSPLVGVTALAAGADQLFGDAVLAAGGTLEVIVPSRDYRDTLPADSQGTFDRLVDAAALVTTLDHDHAGNAAYLAAGLELLDRSDLLVAVWDGEPSRGSGGTADMVARARSRGLPVRVVRAARA